MRCLVYGHIPLNFDCGSLPSNFPPLRLDYFLDIFLLINPKNGMPLYQQDGQLVDAVGNSFPIINGIPRFVELDNYSETFGFQWNRFVGTQLDSDGEISRANANRFFAETHWNLEDLTGQTVLEVGSGAGKFSNVILKQTEATLVSVDSSTAVEANRLNNGQIAPNRLSIVQASIYELPFPESSFDKAVCLGVLQHVPNVANAVKALVEMVRPGGEIVVDFYPKKGWWTKVSAKYILRPLLKRLSHRRLLGLIELNIDWLLWLYYFLLKYRLGLLCRFLPICAIQGSFPSHLTKSEIREWAILDTFDMFSPMHDQPQWVDEMAAIFERYGVSVTFAGYEKLDCDWSAAVVRGVRGPSNFE